MLYNTINIAAAAGLGICAIGGLLYAVLGRKNKKGKVIDHNINLIMGSSVRHTCPAIDQVINGIRAAIRESISGRALCDTKSIDLFDVIAYELHGLEDILEELRSDNSRLRAYGHTLERENKYLEDKLAELGQII